MYTVVMYSTRYSCQILMKLEFSRKIFEKQTSNFVKIRPAEAELFHVEGQTDRYDGGNSRLWQFCVRA
jgi:hypothetical protein